MGTWKQFIYKMASQQQSASEDTSEVVLIATKKYQSITENKQPGSVSIIQSYSYSHVNIPAIIQQCISKKNHILSCHKQAIFNLCMQHQAKRKVKTQFDVKAHFMTLETSSV